MPIRFIGTAGKKDCHLLPLFHHFLFEDGAYLLLARLSDPMTKEELFFANDSYDKQYRGYVLGTLQIKPEKYTLSGQ